MAKKKPARTSVRPTGKPYAGPAGPAAPATTSAKAFPSPALSAAPAAVAAPVRSDPRAPSDSLVRRLAARDLPAWGAPAFLAAFIVYAMACFALYAAKPVGKVGAWAFPEGLGYQNLDSPGWVLTGLMLPGNAPKERAMRPLFPAVLVAARAFGAVPTPVGLDRVPPGAQPYGAAMAVFGPAVRVFRAANVAMLGLALWMFFALARRFGMVAGPAACATAAAGGAFGFAFMVTQATPEVFSSFAVVASLVAIQIGLEIDPPEGLGVGRSAATWAAVGAVAGVLVLGKEIFNILIFGGLLLLFTRRWAGLAAFCVTAVAPTLAWNYYMAKVVGAFDPAAYLNEYKFVVWLVDLARTGVGPLANGIVRNFITQAIAFGWAFWFVPVAMAAVGLAVGRTTLPRPRLVTGAFVFALYALLLLSNVIYPRISFMAWPAVYFFAWAGVEAVLCRMSPNARWAWRLGVLAAMVALGTRDPYAFTFYG